jgi:hypothetical protein
MKTSCSSSIRRWTCITVSSSFFFALSMFTNISSIEAGAPMSGSLGARVMPYAESICNNDPNVFFCEDFQDSATLPRGGNNSCNGIWPNPAWARSNYCFAVDATAGTDPTIVIPGSVTSSGNKVMRLGITPGANTIDGFLSWQGAGKNYTEYYIRYQFYYSSNVQFPTDLDIKQMFTQNEQFLDNTSADFQNGVYIIEDYHCHPNGVLQNYNDVPVVRYGYAPQFQGFPINDEYCLPLSPGLPADNVHAPSLQKNRWYTIEVHFKLSTSSSVGLLEAWLDGNLMYRTNRATCGGACGPMSYVFFTGYKNPGEPNFDGYVEYDNIVMSTAPIGLPGGGASPTPPPPSVPTSTPQTPSNLTVQ